MQIHPLLLPYLFGSCIFWCGVYISNYTLRKTTSSFRAYAIFSVYFIIITILYFRLITSTFVFIDYLLGALPYIITPLLYRNNISTICFVSFTNHLSFLILQIITNIIIQYNQESIMIFFQPYYLNSQQIFSILLIVLGFIYIIIVWLLIKNILKTIVDIKSTCFNHLMIFPFIAFFTLLITLILYTEQPSDLFTLLFVLLILCILSFYASLFTISKKGNPNKQIKHETNVQQNIKEVTLLPENVNENITSKAILQCYFQKLLDNFNECYIQEQELDHNLSTIHNLIYNQDLHNAIHFIQETQEQNCQHTIYDWTSHSNLNILLSYYNYCCHKYQIILQYQLSIFQEIQIDEQDLYILFSVGLENAIDACNYLQNPSQRFIHVEATLRQQHLSITIKNSFDGYINKVNQQLVSRKVNGGSGIPLLQSVVKKYKGTIQMQYPQNTFILQITIKCIPQMVQNQRFPMLYPQ